MSPQQTKAGSRGPENGPAVQFTVERANRALVLVRKVVADIVSRYHRLMHLRHARERLTDSLDDRGRVDQVAASIAHCVEDLHALKDELSAIGCVLRDWRSGLIDFPAERDGRQIWLCWQLGETEVEHWHEMNEGFAGRKFLNEVKPA